MDNLPPYMIPQHWSILKEIPLTPSGKADRKSLLSSVNFQRIQTKIEIYNPNIKSDLEKKIVNIWASVLHIPIDSIGLSDNFFSLGGHSLLVVQIINRIRNAFEIEQIELSSLFKYPNFKDFVSYLQNIHDSNLDRPTTRKIREVVMERNPRKAFPLSFAQQLIWLHIEKTGSMEMYNDFTWINMSSVNEIVLEYCINTIFEKYETLRTTIFIEKGTPFQEFAEYFWQPLQIVEFIQNSKTVEERETLAKEWSSVESRKPFNLSNGPLVKFVLIRLDENVNKLCIIAHHLVMDGVSLAQVVLPELCSIYQDNLKRNITNLSYSAPNIHYGEYVLRQQQRFENLSPKDISSISFWKSMLADLTPLTLPTDRVKRSISSSNGKAFKFSIPSHLVNKIYLLCQQYQTTVYIALMTVIKMLLHRYTGQEDICICGITSGRDELATEKLVGHFTNLVTFRNKIEGGSSFLDVLKKVTKSAAEVYENQDIPFLKIISESKLNYAHLNQILSSVVFSMELDPPENELGWTVNQLDIDTSVAKFDLSVRIERKPKVMNVLFEYNTDIFKESTIQRLSNHFLTLIENATKFPESKSIETLDILSPSERETVLRSWNNKTMDYPKTKTIYQLFEEQVVKTPNEISVRDHNGDFLTYQELHFRANSLESILLRKYSISSANENFVVILLPQSIDFVVSCLAVLKSGAAFIPLSEDFPLKRIQFVLKDSNCQVLISNSKTLQKCGINPHSQINHQDKSTTSILNLTDDSNFDHTKVSPSQEGNISSSAAAYAIYTSGSTGQPKGVIISHKSVINFSFWHINENNLSSKDRSALLATPAFDISIFEMFPYLFCGASLFVAPPDEKKFPKSLLKWFQDNQITMAYLTAALAEPFVKQDFTEVKKPFSLKKLYTGGDSIAFYPDETLPFDLINSYGPTETTISATEINLKIYKKKSFIPPIGRPMSNYQIFILDKNMNPVPIGITGEICIAGDGLAKGYLNRPELTAEKFITKSINDKSLRLYKTGDLGCWISDGNIRFIGRIDEQVKIRGFRVELGEIQSKLDEHSSVEQSVVLVRNNGNDKEIVCYIQPSENINNVELESKNASKQIELSQTLFEEIYQLEDTSVEKDKQASTIGWINSFTGSEIPPAEMEEWVQATVAQIMALKPKKVLEIGCGSGLILEQISPLVQSYTATDFSSTAINYLQKRLENFQNGTLLRNTKLIIRPGDVFSKNEIQAYDTIIINSVVQYFPDLSYLTKVLEGAVNATKSGGHIFVGDIRNLSLLEAFHGAVQRYKAVPTTTIEQWRHAMEKAMESEEELVIHHKFFYNFAESQERLSHATTQIKRGGSNNEMNCFRYDAVLHLDSNDSLQSLEDWKQFESFENLINILQKNSSDVESDVLAIKEIPNSRVFDDLVMLELKLVNSDERLEPSLQNHLNGLNISKINPEEVAAAAESFGFNVRLNLSENPAYFDAIFCKDFPKNCSFYQSPVNISLNSYSNQPLKQKTQKMMLNELKCHLKNKLPSYMIPVSWYFVDSIPTTVNGKIDKTKLAQIDCQQFRSAEKFVPPTNILENQLCEIWSEILNYPVHRISVVDNFFEIGGNSVLAIQLLEVIRQKYETQIQPQILFNSADIQQLSKIIQKRATAENEKDEKENYSSLILMKSASNKGLKSNPIFFIHPIGGTGFCYKPFTKYFDANRNFYAIQDQSILNQEILFESFEEMAASYIKIIRQCHPNGPIVIGGHSFGGLVAFEMARQLGPNEVELVILIDSSVWSAIINELEEERQNQEYFTRYYEEIRRQKYEQLNLPNLETWLPLGSHRFKMALGYCPQLVESKVILFKAEEQTDVIFLWQAYCKVPLTEVTISGDHDTMLLEPNVRSLTKELHQFL